MEDNLMENKGKEAHDWHSDIRLKLEQLVDGFVVDGARQKDVFEAIRSAVDGMEQALFRDPDPADDDSEETVDVDPSNGWPAA